MIGSWFLEIIKIVSWWLSTPLQDKKKEFLEYPPCQTSTLENFNIVVLEIQKIQYCSNVLVRGFIGDYVFQSHGYLISLESIFLFIQTEVNGLLKREKLVYKKSIKWHRINTCPRPFRTKHFPSGFRWHYHVYFTSNGTAEKCLYEYEYVMTIFTLVDKFKSFQGLGPGCVLQPRKTQAV